MRIILEIEGRVSGCLWGMGQPEITFSETQMERQRLVAKMAD
ncbi:MAG: hypothetical protein ACFNLD_10115 [Kingella oralis]